MYMVDCQWRALHQDGYKYLVSKKRERNKEKNWVGTSTLPPSDPRRGNFLVQSVKDSTNRLDDPGKRHNFFSHFDT